MAVCQFKSSKRTFHLSNSPHLFLLLFLHFLLLHPFGPPPPLFSSFSFFLSTPSILSFILFFFFSFVFFFAKLDLCSYVRLCSSCQSRCVCVCVCLCMLFYLFLCWLMCLYDLDMVWCFVSCASVVFDRRQRLQRNRSSILTSVIITSEQSLKSCQRKRTRFR